MTKLHTLSEQTAGEVKAAIARLNGTPLQGAYRSPEPETQISPRTVRVARTTTNAAHPNYPNRRDADTFVVELGQLTFTERPGKRGHRFTPYSPSDYRIAHNIRGQRVPYHTVLLIYLNHDQWEFEWCCGDRSGSSSSHSSSSRSSSPSSSRSSSPSSSVQSSPSSQSSNRSSSAPSSAPSSSDLSSGQSSGNPSSAQSSGPPSQPSSANPSSGQPSSQGSSANQSSANQSSAASSAGHDCNRTYCAQGFCTYKWTSGAWVLQPGNTCPGGCSCRTGAQMEQCFGPGTFEGQFTFDYCLS